MEKTSVCTFFGHADAPQAVRSELERVIRELIENEGVTVFYAGVQGAFDQSVHFLLDRLKEEYPRITHYRVLPYRPVKKDALPDNTLLPDGIETTPRRFAILYRNKWMLQQAQYVVTYVTHSWGGAAKFKTMAEKQKKKVINITIEE